MDNVHFKVVEFSIYRVLRRCMEMELKGLVLFLGSVGKFQFHSSLFIRDVDLYCFSQIIELNPAIRIVNITT